jgi:predicted TIM-barrel fold metal-dependent hydrolase
MKGKIALEEHLSTPQNNSIWDSSGEAARNGKAYMDDVEKRLPETSMRLDEMNRNGIEFAILSLTSPGAQALTNTQSAVDFARLTNDFIAEHFVAKAPKRLRAFATVALQSPRAAADELERAVKQLGMCGVLINGYTNLGDANTAQYLDEEPVWEFWDKVASLNVPVYLHPLSRFPASGACTRGIRRWLDRPGALASKPPLTPSA